MLRDKPIDPNWLQEAVVEFDREQARKPKWTGYSPFAPRPASEHDAKDKL